MLKKEKSALYHWHIVQSWIFSVLLSLASIQREKLDTTYGYVCAVIGFAIGLFMLSWYMSQSFIEIDNQRKLMTSITKKKATKYGKAA